MMLRNILIKTASVFLTALSLCGMCILLYLNSSSIGTVFILSSCVLAAFVFINLFSGLFSKKTGNIILISASLLMLLYWIITTPYTPCHDSLDLHNVLNYMLHNGNDMSEGIYIKTYMNVFINNKFVTYFYLPFVHLFKNAELGIRFLNGTLLIGTVFFTASASRKLLKKNCFAALFFMLSLIAPVMLLSGPYIYLQSLFISALALFCYESENKILRVLFFILTAVLYVLRPTCFGFLLAFVTLDTIFRFENKRELIKKVVSLVLTVVVCFAFKSALGIALYKTGLHPYPNMQNSGGLWAIELGTRTNGEQTGRCFYTMFNEKEDNADDIQKDFFSLWKYYRQDVVDGTDNYNNIVNLQNTLKQKIIRRTLDRTPSEVLEHLYLKSVNFYKDTYIPYYYKANLNDTGMKIYKDYDKKYFAYFNMIFLLFFICMIINFVKVITNRDKTSGVITALGLSAIAVNIVFLVVAEVQKKYMFDFFIPMVMCTAMTFTFDFKKKTRKSMAALMTAGLIAAFSFNESLYDIKIFKGAKTNLVVNGEESTFNVKMEKTCLDDKYYILTNHNGAKTYLYGKNEFSVTFPTGSFDAFILCVGDKDIKGFSAQSIKN